MIRPIIAISAALLISACATKTVSLDTNNKNIFSGKTLTVTKRAKPIFYALTRKNVLFSSVVTLSPYDLGTKITSENNISDPAIYINELLATDFASEFGATFVQKPEILLKKNKLKNIIEQYSNVDYLIDVRTVGWGFLYFPTSFSKYSVNYGAKLRLIDIQKGTVIAEDFCKDAPATPKESPKYSQMLADKAFILKRELNIAANTCINQFKTNILNLPETPLEVIKLERAPAAFTISEPRNDGSKQSTSIVSAYPAEFASLTSGSSIEMREAAINIGRDKLYNDEAIFLASIDILEKEVANKSRFNEKTRSDGLAWCAINLGRSGDKRAIPVLTKVKESDLPRKVKSHAVAALKQLSKS